jgi:DNA methylase
VAGEKDPWYGDITQSTLWHENKLAANRVHPTAKPVELVERALRNSSKSGDLVADLFGGSGSTLIACERRNRKARLMEIDPRYADCTCRRFQEYTGGPRSSKETGDRLTRSRRNVTRRRRESFAAAGRLRSSKPNCSPAIRTSRACAWRSQTGRRSGASSKTRNAAGREPGGAMRADLRWIRT